MPSLTRLPLTIARTAIKLPLTAARYGITRVFGEEQRDDAAPSRSTPVTAEREQRATASATTASPRKAGGAGKGKAATKPKTAAKRAPRARAGAATSVPQPPAESTGPTAAESELEGHVDREAVEVMSLGPADDPGAEITIDPEVLKLGEQES